MQNNTEAQKKRFYSRLTNVSLLVFGLIMTTSGLYIQLHYHLQESNVLGLRQWTFIHKWSALIFMLIVISHILLHIKWFKLVLKKQLFRKNRITIILTISMIIVSILGFAPWLLTLFPTQFDLRHTLIEIHDKIGVAFIVILICHIVKRWRWYIISLRLG